MRLDGRAVGTVCRVTACLVDRHEPRALTESALHLDLPVDEQPGHALITWIADSDHEPWTDAVAPGHP
ncbi:hypothetical protein QRX60_17610 [Amycolatopsis mongoliensis]|uniref:Uncharacterized protein n=1 Tax=Amycolatopsis mongoliensis TaxID=715475 RepID=A0A9Y2JWP3_9PSEU|nr:hypothetical protein [Amycolatopsis sp. 4-36]WIY05573.1 hypothetical protein QRX60_17610 [Amycolatopsis sp. 4-36]